MNSIKYDKKSYKYKFYRIYNLLLFTESLPYYYKYSTDKKTKEASLNLQQKSKYDLT